MSNPYHILNGDCLKEQFPNQIDGHIIVARECLVDGPVKSDSLDELFKVRAGFITESYGDYSDEDYYAKSVAEFEKIKKIPSKSEINLWFEDDLFCQVNFWFVAHLLFNFTEDCTVYLIRPTNHTHYGFGGLNQAELIEAFEKRVRISELEKFDKLWKVYQNDNTKELIHTAKELETDFPFVLQAVEAHVARIPGENNPGRPVTALMEIMNELGTENFAPVFREFNRREAIYGFGDLQVKRLFDEIKNNR